MYIYIYIYTHINTYMYTCNVIHMYGQLGYCVLSHCCAQIGDLIDYPY